MRRVEFRFHQSGRLVAGWRLVDHHPVECRFFETFGGLDQPWVGHAHRVDRPIAGQHGRARASDDIGTVAVAEIQVRAELHRVGQPSGGIVRTPAEHREEPLPVADCGDERRRLAGGDGAGTP